MRSFHLETQTINKSYVPQFIHNSNEKGESIARQLLLFDIIHATEAVVPVEKFFYESTGGDECSVRGQECLLVHEI